MRSIGARPDALLDLLRRRYGLEFPPHRWERVVEAARVVTGAGPAEAARALTANDDLLDAFVARVTVGETYFFREPDQLRVVVDRVLPDIVARRGEAPVRVWSAGCASGEEAYSLAMTLVGAGLADRGRVLATDVSSPALALTREATYGPWSLRGPGAMRALPFLERRGAAWTVTRRVRDLVEVRRLNLVQDEFPRDQDLILCRNVLIYLERGAVARVARGLYEALRPGGWLITASTDPRLDGLAPLEPVVTPAGTLYRRPARPGTAPRAAGAPWPKRSTIGSRLPARRRRREAPAAPPASAAEPGALQAGDELEAIRARAARGDVEGALRLVDDLVRRGPLSAEHHLLRGVLLSSLGRVDDAIAALRGAVYLDPSLVMAQFSLGIALERAGRRGEARRAYAAARAACARVSGDAALPHADGARCADITRAIGDRLVALGDGGAPERGASGP